MRNKKLFFVLLAEAVILIAFYCLCRAYPKLPGNVMAFPIAQLRLLFCFLLSKGVFGQGLAVAVWITVSLLPSVFILFYRRKKEVIPECVTLLFLSGALLFILRYMPCMDPTVEDTAFRWGDRLFSLNTEMFFGAMTIWGIVFLFLVFLIVRKIRNGNKEKLRRYLGILLAVCSVIYTGLFFTTFLGKTGALQNFSEITAEARVTAILSLIHPLPYLLVVAVFLSVIGFLKLSPETEEDELSRSTKRIEGLCRISLAFTAAETALSNLTLYIMVFLRRYYTASHPVDAEFHFRLPVDSLVFAVTILLILHLVKENRKLQDDNNLFI